MIANIENRDKRTKDKHLAMKASEDPWSNPDLRIPSIDTGRVDGSVRHDHYIYGVPKE